MTLSKVVRKGTYQGVQQWGINTASEITPSKATAEKWVRLENAHHVQPSNSPSSPNSPTYPTYISTRWELRSYDVWGNSRDGWEVNDTYRIGEVTLRLRVTVNNPGTPQEFLSAYPTDSQIRKSLRLRRFKLELDGDDLSIYVNRARDSYPCGELYCLSHESLSPIRAKAKE